MRNSNFPLVSVIMPARNSAKYIKQSINSILNQTYKNLELIIIDDASTDNSYQLVKSFHDPRIRVYRNRTQLHAALTRNRGISLSRGKYITNQDSDDISMPARIQIQVDYLESHPKCFLCTTDVTVIDEKMKTIGSMKPPKYAVKLLLAGENYLPNCYMFRRYPIIYYRNTYTEDFDFLIKVLQKKLTIKIIREPLYHYRMNQEGITFSNIFLQNQAIKATLAKKTIQIGQNSSPSSPVFAIKLKTVYLTSLYLRNNRYRQAKAYLLKNKSQSQQALGLPLYYLFIIFTLIPGLFQLIRTLKNTALLTKLAFTQPKTLFS